MKVLLVNKFHYAKGGAETFYFSVAEGFKSLGHDVLFFSMKHVRNKKCSEDTYFVSNKEYVSKVSIISKIKSFFTIIYSKESYINMNKLLETEKPDLIILNNIHRQLTTAVIDAIYEKKIPVFRIVHDLILLCPNYTMLNGKRQICDKCSSGKYINCFKNKCVKKSYLKSFLAMMEGYYNNKKKIINKIDFFITPSNFYRNLMVKNGFDKNKIVHIFNPLPANFNKRSRIIFGEYFLYFGRLSYEKGLISLVREFQKVNAKLIIVGTGPMESELQKLVAESKLGDRIKILGFKEGDELTKIILNCKFVILPSEWYENCPYSAMESMALSKPLIVSNFGGLPELVKNGYNGFVFDNNLHEVILKANFLNVDEYIKMSKNSFDFARQNFDMNMYINKILNIYYNIINSTNSYKEDTHE